MTSTHRASKLSLLAFALFGMGLLFGGPAEALEKKPYDASAFKAAQAAGKPVVVHVTAPWCPVCKAQHQVLDGLKDNAEFAPVTIFDVDFDSQKDVVRAFKVSMQSTLIAYRGSEETGRIVGDRNAMAIETLLASALPK